MIDKEQQAHDFALAVLNDCLSKLSLEDCINDLQKINANSSISFEVYYVAYHGFLNSLKQQHRENLKGRLKLVADKLHSK